MSIYYEICKAPPEKAPMDELLTEYYDLMISRLEAMGGSVPRRKQALDEFWDEIDLFLPPNGRLVLARLEDGDLVGCGSLKEIGDAKGELKRLFVKPETRGHGVGRRLVEIRIEAAREMGLKTLYVDTLKNNIEMRGLYTKLGFEEVDLYEESASYRMLPQLKPFLCYYSVNL
jgi:N-acetylglutamate synthase-like GNAT family acetyltransferase